MGIERNPVLHSSQRDIITVFNWHGADFWLLFFADVAWKLTLRMAAYDGGNDGIDGVLAATSDGINNRGRKCAFPGTFQWQRTDFWCYPSGTIPPHVTGAKDPFSIYIYIYTYRYVGEQIIWNIT